jgi:hypothetical protein
MLSYLRQHAKTLMVTLGSLLMLVFLLPAGGNFLMPDRTNPVVATAGDHDFRVLDRQQAAEDVKAHQIYLRVTGLDFRNPQFFQIMMQQPELLEWMTLPKDSEHWMVLLHDARLQGIDVPQEWALVRGDEIWKQNDFRIGQFFQSQGISRQQFVQMFRNAEIIRRYRKFVISQVSPSEPRLRQFAWNNRSDLSAENVTVHTSDVTDEIPEPTDAQLKAHFDKYKNEDAGKVKPFGFGYRQSHQMQVEYLALSFETILKQLADGGKLDTTELHLEARRRYTENPTRLFTYIPPPEDDSAKDEKGDKEEAKDDKAKKADDKKSDSKTADPKKDDTKKDDLKDPYSYEGKAYKDIPYAIVGPQLLRLAREEKAEKVQTQIFQWIRSTLFDSTRSVPIKDGYRELDDEFKPVSFEKMAEQIQVKFGVLPSVTRDEAKWHTVESFGKEKGIGNTWIDRPGGRTFLNSYLAASRDLRPEPTPGTRPPNISIPKIQSRIASETLVDADGTRYVLRMIKTRPPQAPDSIDTVKEKVTEDLKQLLAYRHLEKISSTLIGWAQDKGLESVAEAFSTNVNKPSPFNRTNAPYSEAFKKSLFELAEEARLAGGLKKIALERRFVIYLDPSTNKLELIHLKEYQPVDEVTYRKDKPSIYDQMNRLPTVALFQWPASLSEKAVKKRIGFTDNGPADEPDEDDDKGDSKDKESAK